MPLILLFISLAGNVALGFYLYKSRKSPPPIPTLDARKILHDLTVNAALVEVRRIDPERILVRSPR